MSSKLRRNRRRKQRRKPVVWVIRREALLPDILPAMTPREAAEAMVAGVLAQGGFFMGCRLVEEVPQ